MPNMVTRSIEVTLAVLFAFYVLTLPAAAAAGIGAGPSTLEITDALRGGEYERLIMVFNLGDDEAAFAFNTMGEAAGWISFFERDAPDIPIDRIRVSGNGEASVLVRVNVPKDAANDRYEAVVVVSTASDGQVGGSIQTVTLSAQVAVSITVTGTQILEGIVTSIRTRDVEEGYPLKIEAYFQNTGNVDATPQFDVEVARDGATVATFAVAEARVRPEESEMLRVECDTTDQMCGEYLCNVVVSLNSRVIAGEELDFAILPRGTLTRSGVCSEITLEGTPQLGIVSKICATFLNDGQIDTKAKLAGEVYHNGALIDVISGDEILIPVGYSAELVAYLRLETPGKYTLKTHVLYEGKITDVQDLSFEVMSEAAPSSATEVGGGLAWQWVLFGTLVALMLAGLVSTYWQRRQKAESVHVKD